MTAEAALGREQEVVDRIAAERRRCERVVVGLGVQHIEHAPNEIGIVGMGAPQLQGERSGARISGERQPQIEGDFGGAQGRDEACAGIGRQAELGALCGAGAQFQRRIGREHQIGRLRLARPLEREYPGMRRGFEFNRVAIGRAGRLESGESFDGAGVAAPGPAVELVEYGSPPVA